MRITADFDPNPVALMGAFVESGKRASKQGAASVGRSLKTEWRAQVSATLGTRLSRSVRLQVYPERDTSFNSVALLFSRAPEILNAFERGVTIKATNGSWLAIPTDAAGRGVGGARITPEKWEQRRGLKLRFVGRRGRTSLLVADGRLSAKGLAVQSRSKTGRGRATVPVFILVPQVRLSKRLNLLSAANRAQASLPDAIADAWVVR